MEWTNTKICIPSYGRADNQKTLRFLNDVQYPKDLIYIFVASEDERQAYERTCPGYHIVVGVPGLRDQRNFISDWLQEDEIYISMDDDIDGIKSDKSFLELIRDAHQMLGTRRGGLWGILPKDDARCFKPDTTDHLSFIIGAFFVCRNHKDIRLHNLVAHDYELSIRYFIKYRAVFRYRGAGLKTKYLGTCAGQGSAQHRLERKRQAVQFLLETYPGLCRFRDKKGEPDLLLNWRYNPSQ
jgi:hypothetical protein